ncbi:MAG: Zn-dependent oligopeptidase [Myxococcota bacterium]|nr:Zn-dependent oligopeptidase [Myxococcota bacterium]
MKASLSLLVSLLLAAACSGPARPPTQPALDLAAAPDPAPTTMPPAPATPTKQPPAVPPQPAGPAPDAAFLVECRQPIADARAQQQVLLDVKDKRTIANTFETFNELTRFVSIAGALASLTQAVHPDAKLRDAARACETEVQAYVTELLLDRRVYDALVAVDVKAADANTKRFAMVTLREYRRAGVALDDKQRARIKQIEDEITTLGQQIQKNVAEDTRSIEVTDKARLAGMPADWVAAHKPDAKGVITITTDYPDYIPFSTYANDDALRKELYIKFRSRGDQANEPLLQQLFALRAEKAKLLGFKNWADYQSDDKMLKGGAAAAQFIERITRSAQKRAKADYNELLVQLKKQDPKATAVGDWQKAYLENQVKKEKYAVDSTIVRQYFPFESSLAGLLDITSLMYDIQYQPARDVKTWHADVKVFDVTRKGDKLGRIYLDMHPRADKYKHAAQFTLKDGALGKQLPVGVLVCNFPAGTALMEHEDVVTMFHEFGHLMHHVLGGHQKWIRQSGVATEHDFVEAPSQMFEEWGWNHDTLSRFAKHHKTGEVIPKDLVSKMRKADKFGLGTQVLQQMFYAAISLTFHQVDPKKLDQLATVKKLQARYTPFAFVEGTKFHTSFTHLVGYSSMYYTYMWSLVIAKDLLTPFEKTGLLDTKVTYRYRDKILAAGGTKDAADLVRDFLGRKYDFKAFEKYLASAE